MHCSTLLCIAPQRMVSAWPQGAMNVHVIKDGALQRYLMFHESVAGDGTRSIGLAASQDGIRGWKRLDRYMHMSKCIVPV
jgi:hypothetical protein